MEIETKEEKVGAQVLTPVESVMAESERKDALAFLAKLELSYAQARYKAATIEEALKARWDAIETAQKQEYKDAITALSETRLMCEQIFESYAACCFRVKALSEGLGETSARVSVCAEVKQVAHIEYDHGEAIRFCVEHDLPQFLKLDVKAFEAAAPHLKLTGVEMTKKPKLYVAQDMIKRLSLNTAEIDAEVKAMFDTVET